MQAVYTAEATSWGGREGRVVSSDGVLDLKLTPPKGMSGEGGDGTNPEQLFAAGWSACFHSALRSVARHDKVELGDSAVTATVSIGRDEEVRGFKLEAMIEVEIPGVERSIRFRLADMLVVREVDRFRMIRCVVVAEDAGVLCVHQMKAVIEPVREITRPGGDHA